MRDLQRRLGAAGFSPTGAEAGFFCAPTESALRAFQLERGLRVTGSCDEDTWRAIVEASWKLGDRLLLLTAPNLRGDDVAELQVTLARIGFDCGRVDGIFGPATARALEEFQRNSGLSVDGVCGSVTVKALHLLARQTGTGPGIVAVRELVALAASTRELAQLRVVVGQFGGLSPLTRQLVQALRQRSASVVATDSPESAVQATVANRFAAHVYVGFEASPDAPPTVHFYRVPQFESAGGRALASAIAVACSGLGSGLEPIVEGMRLPVLRETRMPAVLVTFGEVHRVVDHASHLVDAIVTALAAWAASPAGVTPAPS